MSTLIPIAALIIALGTLVWLVWLSWEVGRLSDTIEALERRQSEAKLFSHKARGEGPK